MDIKITLDKKDLFYLTQILLSTGSNFIQNGIVIELKESNNEYSKKYEVVSDALRSVLTEDIKNSHGLRRIQIPQQLLEELSLEEINKTGSNKE